jgi:hypothetical protein
MFGKTVGNKLTTRRNSKQQKKKHNRSERECALKAETC